jgi:phosphopantothenoylcysteine decarboxylase/phosphopantothenate--cysteine ligase
MFDGRVKIFPAMHEEMFLNKRIQENLNKLHQDFDVYGPRYGRLDIGDEGLGRLLEPFEVKNTLIPNITDKVYVVSGPTKEYIDDIRYISNRSSGKQGRALALESHARGFDTTLISSINYDDINTIKQLVFSDTKTLLNIINSIDISNGYLFMPAAISDFIPQRTKGKMNRKLGEKKIKLSPNIDIIKEIKNDNPNLTVVGFSAQLNDDINFDKMKEKNLDYLITNDVSNQDIGFDSNNNEVTIIDKNANTIHLSLKNKYLIAKEILDHVIK